jgi:two-component system OmpR family sensor kinase
MGRLSTELLDRSRLDSGTASFRSEPFDLEAVVHDVVSEFAAVAERAGSTVRLADPFPEIDVVGDDLRAGQIVRILVDNALKHNPPGVNVLIDPEARDGRVRLAVADDGPTIPEEARARLFDRFARGRTTAEGSGLGLAIARELALRMHGRLDLDQRGRSKAFVLDLPGGPRLAPAPDAARVRGG